MGTFPDLCRAAFSAELGAVMRLVMGATKKSEEQRTIRSRRTHFLWWTKQRGIYEFLFPIVQSEHVTTDTLNYIMACYAVFLATGHTIYQRQVRSATIDKYLHAAATFIQFFDKYPHRDARKEKNTTSICPPVKKVVDQVKKFENISDKREAYTLAMQKEFHFQNQGQSKDCKNVALEQWHGTALQGGNRRYEWCQSRGKWRHADFEKNPKGQCMAFTLADIKFMGHNKRRMNMEYALSHRSEVEYVQIMYRWQKNNEHGLPKVYTRNTRNAACDSVEHLLNICDRYIRLVGIDVTDMPLAIYQDTTGQIRNITSDDVKTAMRMLARKVYNITSKKELSKWSSHSLRVGACCILWAKGFSADFIQRTLRWKSESWKDYVRDLIIHSSQHNEAMADAWDVPIF